MKGEQQASSVRKQKHNFMYGNLGADFTIVYVFSCTPLNSYNYSLSPLSLSLLSLTGSAPYSHEATASLAPYLPVLYS